MKTGAAYIRVSTDDQLEFSPDSQLHRIRDYALANQIELSDSYIFMEEEGRSGRSAAHRPEFQRMIGIARTRPRPFDVILVWKFSRFARSREDSVVYKSMLRKQCGVEVVSVSENLGDDRLSILIEAFIEAMDEWYSINLSEEVTRGMAEKASRGGVVGSPAYGYRVRDGVFVPVPEEAAVVRFAFEGCAGEGLSCRELARLLNGMGVRTRRGCPLEARTVEYLLRNPVYTGKIRWSPDGPVDRRWDAPGLILAEGRHEPLISQALFDAVQRRLDARSRRYAHQPARAEDFLLRGLVRCSDCGGMLVRSGRGLQCHAYAHGNCAVSHYISMARAEERVISLLERTLGTAPFPLFPAPPAGGAGEELAAVLLRRTQAKLERARAAYEAGVDSLAEYQAHRERLLGELDALCARREAVPPVMESCSLSDLRGDALPGYRKNAFLRGFIDRIVFDRAENRFRVFFLD